MICANSSSRIERRLPLHPNADTNASMSMLNKTRAALLALGLLLLAQGLMAFNAHAMTAVSHDAATVEMPCCRPASDPGTTPTAHQGACAISICQALLHRDELIAAVPCAHARTPPPEHLTAYRDPYLGQDTPPPQPVLSL